MSKDNPNIQKCDILFICPSYHRRLGSGIVPSIGLGYLVSSLREGGFSARILDCGLYFDSLTKSTIEKMKRWLRRKLASIKPRLAIGIGPCTTPSIRSILAVSDVCSDMYPQIPLILGGPLTLIPGQEWLFFERIGASVIIKGDGEHSLSKTLAKFRDGKSISGIPGVQTGDSGNVAPFFVDDLDRLPHPSWDEFKMHSYRLSIRRDFFVGPSASITGSRGCAYHCAFCISGQLIKYRRHSFEYIAAVVETLHKRYGVRSIALYDDSLFPNESRINSEIRVLGEVLTESVKDLLWQIEIRPNVFYQITGETFEYVFSHGCRQINIGVEKVSLSQLRGLSKPFSIEQLRETCLSVSHTCPGLRLTGTFILGGPGETVDSIGETIQFSTKLGLLFAHYYPLELYPATPIYESVYGQDETIWFDKIMTDKLPWGEIVYEGNNISSTQLMGFVQLAYRRFYERCEWEEMAKRHLHGNYEEIRNIVRSWEKNRFRLG